MNDLIRAGSEEVEAEARRAAELADLAGLGERRLEVPDPGVLAPLVKDGRIVRWEPGLVLTYRVARGTFASAERYDQVASLMGEACRAWEGTCGVDFLHRADLDAALGDEPAGAVFVVCGDATLPCTFFPTDPPDARFVGLFRPDLVPPQADEVAIGRRLLANVLGFVVRDDSPVQELHFTPLDREVARLVYGPPLVRVLDIDPGEPAPGATPETAPGEFARKFPPAGPSAPPPVEEVLIRLSPARAGGLRATERTTETEPARVYDAFVYAADALRGLGLPVQSPRSGFIIAGLPLVGLETVTVRWGRYQDYLGAYVDEATAASPMADRLHATLSPGLKSLIAERLGRDGRPVLFWWASDTPELEDMPWELAAYGRSRLPPERFLFARGRPPERPTPAACTGDRLRLAVVHDPRWTPAWLLDAFAEVANDVAVDLIADRPRDGLREAVRAGCNAVHIVADGFVSSAYEGILYLHDPAERARGPELSPSELSSLLAGSSVGLVSLSDARRPDPDQAYIGKRRVPSVYRAFAHFGATRQRLPTVVAPLGPLREDVARGFWTGFYRGLAASLDLTAAIARGRGGRALPVAAFLRQRSTRLFRRATAACPVPGSEAVAVDAPPPARVSFEARSLAAQIEQSSGLVDELGTLRATLGELPPGISSFLKQQTRRLEDLEQRLDSYLRASGEVELP